MDGKTVAVVWGKENGGFYVENDEGVFKINLGRLAMIVWKDLDIDSTLIYACDEIQLLRDENAAIQKKLDSIKGIPQ